jgi:hypothetical protein
MTIKLTKGQRNAAKDLLDRAYSLIKRDEMTYVCASIDRAEYELIKGRKNDLNYVCDIGYASEYLSIWIDNMLQGTFMLGTWIKRNHDISSQEIDRNQEKMRNTRLLWVDYMFDQLNKELVEALKDYLDCECKRKTKAVSESESQL